MGPYCGAVLCGGGPCGAHGGALQWAFALGPAGPYCGPAAGHLRVGYCGPMLWGPTVGWALQGPYCGAPLWALALGPAWPYFGPLAASRGALLWGKGPPVGLSPPS